MVQTHRLSAAQWTGNSMESLMEAAAVQAIAVTKVESHARTRQRRLRCFPGEEWVVAVAAFEK